jgi:hypothetical protein
MIINDLYLSSVVDKITANGQTVHLPATHIFAFSFVRIKEFKFAKSRIPNGKNKKIKKNYKEIPK